MVATLAKLRIVPGQEFDAAKLDPVVAKAINAAPRPAQGKIMGHFKEAGALEKDGCLQPRPASAVPTISSGHLLRQSNSARTAPRVPFIRYRKQTASVSRTAVPTSI